MKMLIQPLIAFDQLINTFIWAPLEGFGYADETISARAWRLRDSKNSWFWKNFYKFINVLFFFQENHCLDAYNDEFDRKQYPDYYVTKMILEQDREQRAN